MLDYQIYRQAGSDCIRVLSTSDNQLVIQKLLDVVSLEGNDNDKDQDFEKHEVEVPVLVGQQSFIVLALARH